MCSSHDFTIRVPDTVLGMISHATRVSELLTTIHEANSSLFVDVGCSFWSS